MIRRLVDCVELERLMQRREVRAVEVAGDDDEWAGADACTFDGFFNVVDDAPHCIALPFRISAELSQVHAYDQDELEPARQLVNYHTQDPRGII